MAADEKATTYWIHPSYTGLGVRACMFNVSPDWLWFCYALFRQEWRFDLYKYKTQYASYTERRLKTVRRLLCSGTSAFFFHFHYFNNLWAEPWSVTLRYVWGRSFWLRCIVFILKAPLRHSHLFLLFKMLLLHNLNISMLLMSRAATRCLKYELLCLV